MSRLRIVLFLGIFSLLLYIANLVIYEALVAIFSFVAFWQLFALGALLGILSGSFILSTMLGMRYYNIFTQLYYMCSTVWIGTFVYLLLASLIYEIFTIIVVVPNTLGVLLLALAILISVYGVVHARDIRITEVEIYLPQLPTLWQGRRAVWMSDLHLGQLHGPSFARRIVAQVNALPHDIVFIGGDLYDGTGAPDIDELTAPLKGLSAPLGTYFITGNHEEFGDSNRFIKAVLSQGIDVLQDRMVEVEGMQLIGVDYHNASDTGRFKTILSQLAIDATKPSILLKHEPKDLEVAKVAGVSLQISGHTHKAQLWPLEYLAQIIYKGFAYGLKNFDGMQVYTSSGTGTWGPPMRVGTDSEIVLFTFTS